MFGKVVTIALTLAATAYGVRDLNNYSFEEFLTEFNLKYHPSELPARKKLFENELARVQAHNAKNLSWKETITRFSAMTAAEKKSSLGRNKGVAQAHQKSFRSPPADFKLRPLSELPKSVDWREAGIVTAVKDQGHCGSCWAFASTAVIESYVAKNSGLLFDLSPEQIAMCAPNPDQCGGTGGCAGATAEIAFDYVAKSAGVYQEFQYSYSSYYGSNYDCAIPAGSPVATIGGYVKLAENNYTSLMNAVATLGPIAISVDASTWHAYAGGVYNGCNQAQPDINHAVVLMGYGEEDGQKYWLVRNSWNPKWGEKGYIKLLRTDTEEENCGTDITPQDGTACAGQTDPVKVCGTCGVLFDSSYPTGAKAL